MTLAIAGGATTATPPPFDWRQFIRACAVFAAMLFILSLCGMGTTN